MRTDKEIDTEIVALKKALALKDRWNAQAREQIEAQLQVLEKRMDLKAVDREWYEDETTPDYREGDNDVWSEADGTARWLAGEKGYDSPSKGIV